MRQRLSTWSAAALLGVLTIGTYGIAQYSFSVLIAAVADDTGWSPGVLAGAFSLGLLGSGAVALIAGRIFDRVGSGPILLPAVAVGSAAYFVAAWAEESWQFVIAWAIGGAALGGATFYNVTIPMVTRIYRERRTQGVSVLTFFGALASPLFLPIAGEMIEAWGWRDALRGLVVLTLTCALPAAILVHAPPAPRAAGSARHGSTLAALREPAVMRALVVLAVATAGNSILLVHQVAAMQAAGLTLAAASAYAGARGFMQIPGRLLLVPLTSRAGLRGGMAVCYVAAATASLALLISGTGLTVPLILYYTAFAGMSLGMLSALIGLFQADVYGDSRIGSLTGVAFVLMTVSQAIAAWVAGLAVDWTGGYTVSVGAVVVLQAAVIGLIVWQRAAPVMETPGTIEAAGIARSTNG